VRSGESREAREVPHESSNVVGAVCELGCLIAVVGAQWSMIRMEGLFLVHCAQELLQQQRCKSWLK
jgi:hypothetical protein